MRAVRIILLILIIVGIGLIVKRDVWVPKFVGKILQYENSKVQKTPLENIDATQ